MTKKKTETFPIVVAWVAFEAVHDGKPYARDLGARPGFVRRPVGKACMWLNHGTRADVAKAKAYAEAETAKNAGDPDRGPIQVFTFEPGEQHPLERARRAVEAAAGKST